MKRVSFVFIVFLIVSLFLPLYNVEMSPALSVPDNEGGSFGNPVKPQIVNWSRFWKLFNAHSAWDLEYNNGSGWISDKSQLQIIKNYSRLVDDEREYNVDKSNASAVKITLNFTAKYQADYRLTFGINLDVKNYTHKEGAWNYTITYKNYTVYFDWSDIKDLPLDSVQHGVKPVGEEQWFWFRIRKNNIAQGKNVVIDPSFGNTNEETAGTDTIENHPRGHDATPAEDGTADSITVHLNVTTADHNVTCALYNVSANAVITNGETEERTISFGTYGWETFNFVGTKPTISSTTEYSILAFAESTDGDCRILKASLTGGGHDKEATYPTFPTYMYSWNRKMSIYCNYTVAGGVTYTENPSINLVFSLASTTTFYGTYTLNPSVNLVFALASSLQHITAVWNVNPAINLVFSLSSSTQTYRTYIQNHAINLIFNLASTANIYRTFIQTHSINLVFSIASTVQHITGQIFHVNPSIIINFALSSTTAFIQHYWKVSPSVILDFVLSSSSILIEHLFHVSASINLIFQLSSTTVIVVPTDIDDVLALAAIAFILAISGFAYATTKKD